MSPHRPSFPSTGKGDRAAAPPGPPGHPPHRGEGRLASRHAPSPSRALMTPTPTLLSLAAAAVVLALAAPARADAPYDACMDKAVTNPDYAQCGAALVAREDQRLNAVWARVFPKLEPAQKAQLRAEQRLWIAWKDKSCGFWLEGNGREGQVIHYPACRAQVIADRRAFLADVAETLGVR